MAERKGMTRRARNIAWCKFYLPRPHLLLLGIVAELRDRLRR